LTKWIRSKIHFNNLHLKWVLVSHHRYWYLLASSRPYQNYWPNKRCKSAVW